MSACRAEFDFDVARAILDANPYGFLVTRPADGDSSARLVHHLQVDADDTLWIGTSPRSRKAQEARAGHRCAYAVEDRQRFAYVTLYGYVELVDKPETLVEKWVPSLETFFPAGPTGGDFVLLALFPMRVELMDFAAGIHPEPYGLVPAVLHRRAAGWRTVEPQRAR